MSRSYTERRTAWQVWATIHTDEHRGAPVAYVHHCGALGHLGDDPDLGSVVCPGCRHELARPESECQPLYGRDPGSSAWTRSTVLTQQGPLTTGDGVTVMLTLVESEVET